MRQAPLSMGFPRQEYWGGLPFPSPGEGLGEQQSTRPDQPLCAHSPHPLLLIPFLSIQPLSKGHPCHPLLRVYCLPVPCPGQLPPTTTKDGLKPQTRGCLGLASCRRNQKHWILTSLKKRGSELSSHFTSREAEALS